MVKLAENKHDSENKAIERLPIPVKVYLPLIQHLGKICNPEVKAGDAVSLGQRIASVQAHVYAPIHATISGRVVSIVDWPHPVLGRAKAIVLEGDGPDDQSLFRLKNQQEIDNLKPEDIRRIVLDAGIVGMGGASFPTHIKLNPPQPVDTLIINGAECEPYLTADARLMVEKAAEISRGIGLVARCLGVKKIYIAIEDNKPEAIQAFSKTSFKVKVLKSDYPQGGEKQLIQNILGKQIPRGKLPFDIGVVVQNVATVYAVYEAVYRGKPLIERLVTVTGSCVENPRNLLVRIGTPIKDLIDFCGPLKEEPAKIIIGGPMMGIAQYTDEVPIIKSSGGLLLMNKKEAKLLDEQPCIRCAACVRSCPVGLMPCQINLASERSLWNLTKEYAAGDCIECGICNYVCPANRRLLQTIKRAKLESIK